MKNPDQQSKSDLLVSAAISLRDAGYLQKAVEVLQDALSENPEFVPTHILLGALYQETGEDLKAETHYRWAVNLEPDNAEALQGLGLFLLSKKRYPEAFPYLEKHFQKQPSNSLTLGGLIECLENLPDGKNQIGTFLKKAWEDCKDWEIGVRYGRYLLDEKQYEEARETLSDVVNLKRTAQTLTLLANAYSHDGDYHSAIRFLEEAIWVDRGFADAWKDLAECYFKLGEHEKALAAVEQAIAIEPKDYSAWLSKSSILFGMENFEGVLQTTKFGIETILSLTDPLIAYRDLIGFYILRYYSYANLMRLEDAISEFETALKEGNDLISILAFFLSKILYYANKPKEAVDIINKVSTEDLQTYWHGIKLLYVLGRTQEFWDLMVPALESNKEETIEELVFFGQEAYLIGYREASFELLRQLLRMYPEDVQIKNALANLLIEEDQFAEAEELLLQVAAHPQAGLSGAVAQCHLAYLHALRGEYTNALQACKEVLNSFYKNEETFLRTLFWLGGRIVPDPRGAYGRYLSLADAARACAVAAALASGQIETAESMVEELRSQATDQNLARIVSECFEAFQGKKDAEEIANQIAQWEPAKIVWTISD